MSEEREWPVPIDPDRAYTMGPFYKEDGTAYALDELLTQADIEGWRVCEEAP